MPKIFGYSADYLLGVAGKEGRADMLETLHNSDITADVPVRLTAQAMAAVAIIENCSAEFDDEQTKKLQTISQLLVARIEEYLE